MQKKKALMSQVLDLALPANKRSNGQTEPNL